jgi:hypothetical protein
LLIDNLRATVVATLIASATMNVFTAAAAVVVVTVAANFLVTARTSEFVIVVVTANSFDAAKVRVTEVNTVIDSNKMNACATVATTDMADTTANSLEMDWLRTTEVLHVMEKD